jgi:hypothetical protein
MPTKTSVVLVSIFLILTTFLAIDFSPSTGDELNNELEVKYTVSDGPTLSSPDGIPGYPLTITAEVTGFSSGDVWNDPYGYIGNETNYGIFDCAEAYSSVYGYIATSTQGNLYNTPHVIPFDWVEDGNNDCYDGSDEVSGAASTVVTSSSQTTFYRVWAVSATGEEYLIRGNVSPVNGEISVKWNVDLLQPTGDYQICVDSISTSTFWSMGYDPYYWALTEHSYRNLVETNTQSTPCTNFELNLYDLSLSSEHKLVVPGSTVKISGFVSNPITGGPSDPGSIAANLQYYVEDANGSIVPQVKEIYVNSDEAIFAFAFLLPSNLYQGTSSYYWIIEVDVWANSSTTSQFEMETYTLYTSNLVASIISPPANELVYRDEPFIFQAEAILSTTYTNTWEPLSEHEFSLKIISDGHTTVLNPLMTSDIRGNLLTIINLSSIDISGVATLTLEWENPSTMETDNAQTMIFVADNAYVANNVGKGLNLEAKIVGDSPHEGEDVQVKITAKDDWGNPIPSIYIQHTVQIEVDSSLHYAVTYMFEQFGYDMTNEAGEVLITKSIPAGLNGAAVYVNVIVYNETGYLDSLSFEIPLAEPEIDITLSTGDYHPGEITTIIFSCNYLQGEVTYFWSTISGESGHLSSSGCNSLSEVEIIIPLSQDSAYYSVMVTAVSNQDIISVTAFFPLVEENLEMDIVLFSHGTHVAGENMTIEYNISIENGDGSPIYPLSWETSIVGYPHNNTQGELNSSAGSLNMTLPDSLKSGSYIVNLRIGDAASYTIIDVLTQEDDQHRVDEVILREELESSIGHQISDQSGIIAISALLMAIISFTIAVISRSGGKSEESNTKIDNLFNTPLASNHVSTDGSSQQESAPPTNAVGTLQDGFEWFNHNGKQYYRTEYSNNSWELYKP